MSTENEKNGQREGNITYRQIKASRKGQKTDRDKNVLFHDGISS